MRKLWTARVLFVLAAGGLGAVVIEEHREQTADREPLRTVCPGPYDGRGNAEGPGPGQRGCADYRPARAPRSR